MPVFADVIDVGPAGQQVAGGYKSGDVIEVLRDAGTVWETGVVMPYRSFDQGARTWINVYFPSNPMPAGIMITLDKVRPGSLANLKPPASWSTASVSTIVDALMKKQLATIPHSKGTDVGTTPGIGSAAPAPATGIRPVGPRPSGGFLANQVNQVSVNPANQANPGGKPYVLPTRFSEGFGSEPPPKPVMNGSLPVLPGTAWKELYNHPAPVVPQWLFCKSGHWEVVRYAGAVGGMGKWRASGSTLTITMDTAGSPSDNYSMTFNAQDNVLTVKGGGATFYLLYNGTTQCQ